MDVPVLQPIVQNDDQMEAILDAAVIYGTQKAGVAAAVLDGAAPARESITVGAVPAVGGVAAPALALSLSEDRQLGGWSRIKRHAGAWYEIARPFSLTASTVPVAAAGALAAVNGLFNWPLFLAALLASVLLHIGTNITNEIYDVRI